MCLKIDNILFSSVSIFPKQHAYVRLEVSNSVKSLSKVGSETQLFHYTRALVKLLRRTCPM